jgi:hypothetical protein
MTDIATAIQSLNKKGGNSHEFVVRGEPTNEAEYNSGVDYVSGADANGTAIFSDTNLIHGQKSVLRKPYSRLSMTTISIKEIEPVLILPYKTS